MTDEDSLYRELGVTPVVNAAGTKTRIGGSRIRPEALAAMERAADEFVELDALQARASERIAAATGAEAGYVTSGAAAGLTLAAAAAIAGHDVPTMERLPDTEGIPSDIVVPRTHRTGYDHALRAAGATLVDVGTNDVHLGTGASDVKRWELDRAIDEDCVAVFYVQKPYSRPPLETVVEVAHDNGVPVIVDAAAELPPAENLSRFVETGADMVVFSGGKAIRGPQTTGIVAGKRECVSSIALQQLDAHVAPALWDPPASLIDADRVDGVPRQGLGRPTKVGKEELAGLLAALDAFLDEEQAEQVTQWRRVAERMAEGLRAAGFDVAVTEPAGTSVAPSVVVQIDESWAVTATECARRLRDGDPRVYVGTDELDAGQLTLNPMCLRGDEPDYVVERLAEIGEN